MSLLPCINYVYCKTIDYFIGEPVCTDCLCWYDDFSTMQGYNFALQYVYSPCDICKTTGRLHVDLTIRSICIDCFLLAARGVTFTPFPGTHPLGIDHERACDARNFFIGNKFINNSCDVCLEYQQAQKQHWYAETDRVSHETHILRANAFNDVTVIKSAPYDKYNEFVRSWNPADGPELKRASIQWKI